MGDRGLGTLRAFGTAAKGQEGGFPHTPVSSLRPGVPAVWQVALEAGGITPRLVWKGLCERVWEGVFFRWGFSRQVKLSALQSLSNCSGHRGSVLGAPWKTQCGVFTPQ